MEEEDLLRFMKKEEVDNVFPLFEGAVESGKIKRKSLKNWLVSSLANYFPAPSMTPSYYPFKKKKNCTQMWYLHVMIFLLIQLCYGYLKANNISW